MRVVATEHIDLYRHDYERRTILNDCATCGGSTLVTRA